MQRVCRGPGERSHPLGSIIGLDALGPDEARSFYLEDFGHMSAIDPLVVLSEADRQGRLNAGDLVFDVSCLVRPSIKMPREVEPWNSVAVSLEAKATRV